MKHFKLMKGILACLLSLALVVTCFTVGAKAAATAEKFSVDNKASSLLDVSIKKGDADFTSGDPIEAGDVIVVTATVKEGKTVKNVKFNNEDVTENDGKYTKSYEISDEEFASGLEVAITATEVTAKDVTFNVFTSDSTSDVSKAYKYVVKSDLTQDKVVTLEEILKEAKKGDDTLPEGMILAAEPVALAHGQGETKYTSFDINEKKFTIDKTVSDVTSDSVTIKVAPAKINAVFSARYGKTSSAKDYTAKIEVDNKAYGATSDVKKTIKASEIVAAFQTAGENPETLPEDCVITQFGGGDDLIDANATYEVTVDEPKFNDLDSVHVTLQKAYTIDYDPLTDTVEFESPVKNLVISYASLKAATGKVTKFNTVTTAGKERGYYTASFSLSNKSSGVKIAENKAAYLCIMAGAVTADKKATYTATYTVEATAVKKLAVSFNYAAADPALEDTLPIASIEVTPNSGSKVTYAPSTTDNEKKADFEEVVSRLQYSTDNGATWLWVNGDNPDPKVVGYYVNGISKEDKVEVTVTDYKKLFAGKYMYDTEKKEFILTFDDQKLEVTSKNDLYVDIRRYDGDTVTYTYKAAKEATDEQAAVPAHWEDGNGDAISDDIRIIGTPEAGDIIKITVTPKTYNLKSGATIKIAEDTELTAADFVILEEKWDDGYLSGAKLYAWTQAKGSKIQFRLAGKVEVATDGTVGNPVRNSKAGKSAIKQAAKAPKVKVVGTTGTIAIKNGMDYAVLTAKGTPSPEDWTTILPQNKAGKATAKTLATTSFVPAKKCTDATATMFTTEKIKTIGIETLFENIPANVDKIYVYVRTSAKDGKPASAYTEVEIARATVAPTIKALTSGNLAEAVINEKGTDLAVPTITNNTKDKNTTYYEYLILDKDTKIGGTDGVDLSAKTTKWTKFKDKLTVGKDKSKYAVGTGKAEAHTLAEGSIVLIRRAGTKAGVLPSEYVTTTITKGQITVDKEQKDAYLWTVVTP